MTSDDVKMVDPSRRAFVARLIAAGLSAPKIVSFVLGGPTAAGAVSSSTLLDPCFGDISGNTGYGGSGHWNYSGTVSTLAGRVDRFPEVNASLVCDSSGNLGGDSSGNFQDSSGNLLFSSGNLLDNSANFQSPGGYSPTISGSTAYTPTTSTTVPATGSRTVTLPASAGTRIPLKNEPAKTLAVDAAVAVNRSIITVGLLAPAASKSTKDAVTRYTFTLTPTTKGAKTVTRTVNVTAGKVNSVALTGAAKVTYRLTVTATLKSGKKTVWNGPAVTTK